MSLDNNLQMCVCMANKVLCVEILDYNTLLQLNYETALLLLQMYL